MNIFFLADIGYQFNQLIKSSCYNVHFLKKIPIQNKFRSIHNFSLTFSSNAEKISNIILDTVTDRLQPSLFLQYGFHITDLKFSAIDLLKREIQIAPTAGFYCRITPVDIFRHMCYMSGHIQIYNCP